MSKDKLIKFAVDAKEFKNNVPVIINAVLLKKDVTGNLHKTKEAVLCGVLLNVSLGKLNLIGFNGHQVAYKIFDISNEVNIETDFKMVIPTTFLKSCIDLIKIKEHKIINLIIDTENQLVTFNVGDFNLETIALIGGNKYYPYQKIKDTIPIEFTSEIILNRTNLIKAVEGLPNPTDNEFIKLIPYYDNSMYAPYHGLKVSVGLRNFIGECSSDTIEVTTSKMTLEDTKYLDRCLLLKALKKMKCETLHISTNCDTWKGIDYNPLVIHPIDKKCTEDISFTYVLYPVRPDSPE